VKARRFIINSCVVTLAGIGVFVWLILGFPDTEHPSALGEHALRWIGFILSWPTLILASTFGEPPGFRVLFLFIPSGIVWAALVESVFRWKSRKRANNLLQPTGSGAGRAAAGG
jgi:hypothetical protein